jgi:hypothetical protein
MLSLRLATFTHSLFLYILKFFHFAFDSLNIKNGVTKLDNNGQILILSLLFLIPKSLLYFKGIEKDEIIFYLQIQAISNSS